MISTCNQFRSSKISYWFLNLVNNINSSYFRTEAEWNEKILHAVLFASMNSLWFQLVLFCLAFLRLRWFSRLSWDFTQFVRLFILEIRSCLSHLNFLRHSTILVNIFSCNPLKDKSKVATEEKAVGWWRTDNLIGNRDIAVIIIDSRLT